MEQIIQKYISGMVTKKIAEKTGLSEQKVQGFVAMATPMFMGAIGKNAVKGGKESFFDAVKNDHDGSVFDNLDGLLNDPKSMKGDKILGHVFGSSEKKVEAKIAKKVGVSQDQSKDIMEMLAPMVMGSLGKEQSDKGLGLDDVMGMVSGGNNMDKLSTGMKLFKMFRG